MADAAITPVISSGSVLRCSVSSRAIQFLVVPLWFEMKKDFLELNIKTSQVTTTTGYIINQAVERMCCVLLQTRL